MRKLILLVELISLLLLSISCIENDDNDDLPPPKEAKNVELFSSLEELAQLAATQKEAVELMRKYLDQQNDDEAFKLVN